MWLGLLGFIAAASKLAGAAMAQVEGHADGYATLPFREGPKRLKRGLRETARALRRIERLAREEAEAHARAQASKGRSDEYE